MSDHVCVGVVVGVHGVRGAVKIKSFTAEAEAVGDYGPVHDESGTRRWTVAVTGQVKGAVIAQMTGVRDRDGAEALKGTQLFVPRAALPAAEEGEFYYSDLIGLEARLQDGTVWGVVRAAHDFGAGDVIELARPDGRTEFLPFSRVVVPVVDVAGGHIVVDPPVDVAGEPADEGDSGDE